jgi:hypothetical protein
VRLLLQLTVLVPFGAGGFHVGGIFFHTLTAFHVEIRDVSVPLPHFLFRKGLNPAATALGAAGFNVVTFFRHSAPPIFKFYSYLKLNILKEAHCIAKFREKVNAMISSSIFLLSYGFIPDNTIFKLEASPQLE